MTIEEIKSSTKTVLTPAEVADVLQCDPQLIRVKALQAPELLGFPVCRVGNRTKIPRIPFLRFMGILEDEQTIEEKENLQ